MYNFVHVVPNKVHQCDYFSNCFSIIQFPVVEQCILKNISDVSVHVMIQFFISSFMLTGVI